MELIKLKKRILIIGDSLCLSRNKPEIVGLTDTWPYVLNQNKEFEIIQLGIGGAAIKTLYDQAQYYEGSNPEILIIQSGIVDCAPRALGWLEKEIINSSRLLSFIVNRFMPINLMRRYRGLTYTNKANYKKNINEFIKKFSKSKIIFIGILPASNEYEKLLPGISNNIKSYNKIIKEEIINKGLFLNADNIPMEGIMSDHHHLNAMGHKWLSEEIINMIKKEELN
ncbi:SGNH/GDSL hydrolase family protein [Pedobacter aquatilis]|uniref:SGNH/GDSL hydrolase family protein n=1 Tax=Pedobacter aquatilis TaxID=351343 RepID=UPI00292E5563|nr:SGNH/GDSL hydrolase family protein [Pedobacter aquatilis]